VKALVGAGDRICRRRGLERAAKRLERAIAQLADFNWMFRRSITLLLPFHGRLDRSVVVDSSVVGEMSLRHSRQKGLS
jgi:hypothetical protein